MSKGHVCPYFHTESGCDVGEDYISPHDVETIVGFCNGRYQECMTYRMIEEYGMNVSTLKTPTTHVSTLPQDVYLSPLSRGVIALIGLALGLCLAVNLSVAPAIAAVALMTGGLVLMVNGIYDWRHERAFAATVNCAYGLFAVSLIPLLVLPRAGMSAFPDPWGTTSYLALWGLFSIAIYLSAFEADRWLGIVFGLLTAAILTLSVATAVDGVTLTRAAGGLFAASGLVSLFVQALQRGVPQPVRVTSRSNHH